MRDCLRPLVNQVLSRHAAGGLVIDAHKICRDASNLAVDQDVGRGLRDLLAAPRIDREEADVRALVLDRR